MKQLVYNAIQTPDGTILESRSVHDYRTYKDANGETYMVDGGKSYLRRNINKEPAKELSLYVDDPHELIRNVFTWGTYGKNGDEPFRLVILKDMSDEHITAILDTQAHIPDWMRIMFATELDYRELGE